MNTKKPTWTSSDQRQLDELVARKVEVDATLLQDVKAVVEDFYYRNMSDDDLVAGLIERADWVRDALQPYDSGVRPA